VIVHRAILRLASLIVPAHVRQDWLEEWRAELHYIAHNRPSEATAFLSGVVSDAVWLRRNTDFNLKPFDSPASCIFLLAAGAVIAAISALGLPGPRSLLSNIRIPLAYAILFQVGPALLVLPSVARLALDRLQPAAAAHLLLKIALVIPLVFCGALTASWLIVPSGFGHVGMVGYVLAFRWAIEDHRRRCPVCLHRLSMPTTLGNSSRVLLDWYGTELVCTRGHGMLYMSEVPATSWGANQWQGLGNAK
jgi:hypothetical protein